MTCRSRIFWDLVTDVLDVLERHGHHRSDDQHTGQAVGVIGDLAGVYEGGLDIGYGTYRDQAAAPADPEPARPAAGGEQDIAVLSRAAMTALDLAEESRRDLAGTCTDCRNPSCPACRSRLEDARAYVRIAVRLLSTAQAARTSAAQQPEPPGQGMAPGQDGHPAGWEAGQ
jgi:hypothetical protein